jgi:hypothetical protein
MRSRTIALVLVVLAGFAFMAYHATRSPTEIVYDLGVLPAGVVATLETGDEICQRPIGMPDAARGVALWLGPGGYYRGPAKIEVRELPSKRVLATGDLRQQAIPIGLLPTRLDREVPRGADVELCLRNTGQFRLEVLGDIDTASGIVPPKRFAGRVLFNPTRSTDNAHLNRKELPFTDMTAVFTGTESRTLLERIPSAFVHASRFKPDGVGPWTWWLLLACALVGAPLALAGALRAAEPE